MASNPGQTYLSPGVYVDEQTSAVFATGNAVPDLLGIVGVAVGYQSNTEQFAFSTSNPYRLNYDGVDQSTLTYADAAGNVINPGDFVVTLTDTGYVELTGSAVASTTDGTTVFVSYHYTPADYYTPQRFRTYADVQNVYGAAFNSATYTPGDDYKFINSPLSLAAYLAFSNGAGEVVTCAVPPSTQTTASAISSDVRSGLAAAYTKLLNESDLTLLVAITDGIVNGDAPGCLSDLKASLQTAVNEDLYRSALIGFGAAVTDTPDTVLATSGAADQRLHLVWGGPNGMTMFNGASFNVGNEYLAAAVGGRMASLDPEQSMTRQQVSGFTGFADPQQLTSVKNTMSASGVMVAEYDRSGRIVIRQAVTTDTSSILTRESSIVRSKDALILSLMDAFDNSSVIGAPLTQDLLLSLKSMVTGTLEQAVSQNLIVGYGSVSVAQTSADPSVVTVTFSYQPTFPLNYVMVSFSIDTTTGNTTVSGNAA